jgi:hypothetical protein
MNDEDCIGSVVFDIGFFIETCDMFLIEIVEEPECPQMCEYLIRKPLDAIIYLIHSLSSI